MQSKKANNKQQKPGKTWPWIVSGTLITLLAGIGWLFFTHSRAYQVPEVDDSEQVSPYLTHYLAEDVYNKSQLGAPFDLEIDQFKLNEAIANPQWWPQTFGDFSFSDPMVVFGDHTIYLMGQLRYKELATVMTIALAPTFTDGQLCLNIQSVRLGQLPAKFIVLSVACQTLEAYRPEIERDGLNVDVIEAILKNGSFDPVIYPFGTPLRIKALSAQQGRLDVTFEPIPKNF